MKYKKIVEARFVERPNRFIAKVELENRVETVHVKNTGRCRELLPKGGRVFLSDEDGKERKTRYDLVAVEKNGRIINMDSQAPNMVVKEALEQGRLFQDILEIRPETTYGDSRFDFYVKTKQEEIFIEVKGVTLENDNICAFPDAPSERAVKHVEELIRAKEEGYRGYVLFVIQMEGVTCLHPNEITHKAFGDALRKAKEAGIEILAFESKVTPDSLELSKPVPVYLHYKEEYQKMVLPLLEWYKKDHRKLPWREEPKGYHVWISEIMLQQTRVEAVKPYYHRFMEALPDINSLALAEEEKLLKLWEGLGYYNRARNLQKAAKIMMEEMGGRMPKEYEELLKLPGIGSYTAGAISSIAFGRPYPAVDGNVLRVVSRLTMDEDDIKKDSTKKKVEERLKEVMPTERPGDFNQAMMELGAVVCLPNGAPKCRECPLQEICQAHLFGKEEEFPKKEEKKKRTIEKKTLLLMEDESKYLLHKRPLKGLLAGMYEFPMLEGHLTRKEVVDHLGEKGLSILNIKKLESAKHIFSHKEWHMDAYFIKVDELGTHKDILEKEKWIPVERKKAEEEYPLPSAFAVYVKYLNILQGSDTMKKEKRRYGRKE